MKKLKLNLNDIKLMNDVNLEKEQMNQVFGGHMSNDVTLDTATCTPSGTKNDGDDSWAGESAGIANPAPVTYAN